jgi:hypothetical protein
MKVKNSNYFMRQSKRFELKFDEERKKYYELKVGRIG